jgi:XTP/dITP diphosphohydrolase
VTTLLIATNNPHKVGEIREILGNQFQFLTLNDFPKAPKIVEDANTFSGNATKKAVELATWLSPSCHPSLVTCHSFVLADDSGLEVDALNGAPGVHSARFAAMDSAGTENSSSADNNAKLLRLLKNVPAEKRTARFRCVIVLAEVQSPPVFAALRRGKKPKAQSPQLFDGVCEGRIVLEPRGQSGFGYDPLFVPDGFEQTFAELGEAVKNKSSHRAKALEKLRGFFTTKQQSNKGF